MGGVTQSPIVITAGFAAAILLASIGWQLGGEMRGSFAPEETLDFERAGEETSSVPNVERPDWQAELARLGLISTSTDTGGGTATTSPNIGDFISSQLISGYEILKTSGDYSPEKAALLGQSVGINARVPSTFVFHGEMELTKSADTSVERVLEYRADMRDALASLITDDPPEFETFGYYIETGNPERLHELEEAAGRYRKAEKAALAVVVPQDAARLHLRVVNSLGSYANSLDQLILYADDALSTLAVLRTYNDAEREMLYAFDALSDYYVRKVTKE